MQLGSPQRVKYIASDSPGQLPLLVASEALLSKLPQLLRELPATILGAALSMLASGLYMYCATMAFVMNSDTLRMRDGNRKSLRHSTTKCPVNK